MGVAEDLDIVYAAAKVYKEELCGRRVLFIPNDRTTPFEVFFGADNFMHLCGMKYPVTSKRDFLDIAVNESIDATRLEYTYDHCTDLKISVLGLLVRLDSKASMFERHPSLPGETKADCVAINMNAVMGFIEHRTRMVPDTALNLERRWTNAHKVLAIVKTERNSSTYTRVTKRPAGRKASRDKTDRILASLNRYVGDGDILPVKTAFLSEL